MRVLLAASDLPSEPALVKAAIDQGLDVARRCVDAVDLMAAAAIEPDLPMLVSFGLPRLDVSSLSGHRAVVITGSIRDSQSLPATGVRSWVSVNDSPEDIIRAFTSEVGAKRGVWSVSGSDESPPATRIIAVTCAGGSPGCTTTAIEIAKAQRETTCLIDADVRDPALAFRLGVIDDLSGVGLALRHATNATLTPRSIAASCARIGPKRYLLSGYPGASLHHTAKVVSVAAAAFHTVVVDYGLFTDFPVPYDHRIVVMRAEDLSVARTVRLLRDYPEFLGSSTVAVTGLRGRRTLGVVRKIFDEEQLPHQLVNCKESRVWKKAFVTQQEAQ
jgi:hypothetical protein